MTDRLGVVDALDAAVGPIKTRARGYSGAQVAWLNALSPASRARRSWAHQLKISHELKDLAAAGMRRKSVEFVEAGAQVYRPTE